MILWYNEGMPPGIYKHKSNQLFQKGHIAWNKDKIGLQYHSKESKKKMREAKLGKRKEKSNAWKDDKMAGYPENERIRKSMEYKLWRKAIFVRDNFTCQKYKIRGGILIAHHINNFSDFLELRLAIDNGITLSKKAHKEFHKKYGVKHNTKEQLEEFLCRKI